MTKRKLKNQFNQKDFCSVVRKRYKRRFKKGMNATDAEIMKVIWEYLDEVKEKVIKGKKVNFDKYSYMQVIGIPAIQHSTFGLRLSGKSLAGNFIKKADNINHRRGDFVYGIKYVNEKSKEKIYFDAHPEFSKRVHKELVETNVYYHTVTKICNKKESDKKITKNCN